MNKKRDKIRCPWCGDDALYRQYHDKEWGVPVHQDRKLFEFLILEGAQAGLSWITILRKREAYREAFDRFDFHKIASYNERKVQSLLNNAGIIRNELKIRSAITNAQSFINVRDEYGTFDKYLWAFVDNKPIRNRLKNMANAPASTVISEKLSRELRKKGFKFVGSTICYAFMQAIGMVNDHLVDCYRYSEL